MIMKTIKNIMIAAMVLFAGNAMAQTLSAETLVIPATTAEGELVITFASDRDVTGVQFTITLPEGISIQKNGRKYVCEVGEDNEENYEWKIKDGADASQKIVLIQRIDNTVPPMADGDLLYLTLDVADGAKSGYAKISGQVFSNKGAVYKDKEWDDFQIGIQVGEDPLPTGINSLNADNSNEPAFNLAGQQVGKNYKGIVVKNGKKTLLK